MRLRERYKKQIMPQLKNKFGYNNDLAAPAIKKAVVNVGVGRHSKEKEYIDKVASNLSRITGQKPVLTKAKKAISAFKTKEGMIIGVAVTLRGKRMYDFLEKLVCITFPRVRDFRGISEKQVDKNGNLTIGFRENLAFPEIEVDEIENAHGLEVCIATTAKNKEEGLGLFRLLGFPFKKE
ncbi:50S ribosomal protein L5 [Candidatus Falkowbacteria bacterium]|nr:50S ribosomal protein L5 [Candidatus Falkowbacteria bacterium]